MGNKGFIYKRKGGIGSRKYQTSQRRVSQNGGNKNTAACLE